MKNKRLWITKEDLNFMERLSKEIKEDNKQSNYLNIGIVMGLIFGIIGNLFMVLLYEEYIKFLPPFVKFLIIMLSIAIISFFLYIFIVEDKEFKEKNKNLEKKINLITENQERVEKGEKINKIKFMSELLNK